LLILQDAKEVFSSPIRAAGSFIFTDMWIKFYHKGYPVGKIMACAGPESFEFRRHISGGVFL